MTSRSSRLVSAAQVCSADRDADLSDFIEITFSVAKEIRGSRYRDPRSLSPEEFFFAYRFTENGVVDDESPLHEHLRRYAALCAFLEAGETIASTRAPAA